MKGSSSSEETWVRLASSLSTLPSSCRKIFPLHLNSATERETTMQLDTQSKFILMIPDPCLVKPRKYGSLLPRRSKKDNIPLTQHQSQQQSPWYLDCRRRKVINQLLWSTTRKANQISNFCRIRRRGPKERVYQRIKLELSIFRLVMMITATMISPWARSWSYSKARVVSVEALLVSRAPYTDKFTDPTQRLKYNYWSEIFIKACRKLNSYSKWI